MSAYTIQMTRPAAVLGAKSPKPMVNESTMTAYTAFLCVSQNNT
jgi:hypothetical protein